MGDHYPCELMIGGEIPRDVAEELCQRISQQGVSLDWGDADFTPTCPNQLLEALDEDGLLTLVDDQARDGEMYELEEFLQARHIYYVRHSSGHYEFTESFEWLGPEGQGGCLSSQEMPVIPLIDIQKALTLSDEDALRMIRELVATNSPPTLPPLVIK